MGPSRFSRMPNGATERYRAASATRLTREDLLSIPIPSSTPRLVVRERGSYPYRGTCEFSLYRRETCPGEGFCSMWPPNHPCCAVSCPTDQYHFHSTWSHAPPEPGANSYHIYLMLHDPTRIDPEDQSIQDDLQRIGGFAPTMITAIRRAFRAYRSGGPSTVPSPCLSDRISFDESSDKENIPPLLDWNFDFRTSLYHP